MFPPQGGSQQVTHSLSFILGPHTPDNIQEEPDPQQQDISLEQTSVAAGVNAPAFGGLWNNTCYSADTRL